MVAIVLKHPERYWPAYRHELAWLRDPDIEDGHERHVASTSPDWSAIGAAVEAADRRLLARKLHIDEDGHHVLKIDTPASPHRTRRSSLAGSQV